MKKEDLKQLEKEEEQKQLEKLVNDNCILKVVAGSHAYGTNLPSSDWDERGIFTDITERVILPFEKIEQVKFIQDDVVCFELSKYIPLLLEQNPNVIELLWTDTKDILLVNDMGNLLLDNRKEFLSKKVEDSYIGYAVSQLKRIKGHNKFINAPQSKEPPKISDFISIIWNQTNNKEYNKKIPLNGFVALDLGHENVGLWSRSCIADDKTPNKSWIDDVGVPIVYKKNAFEKFKIKQENPDLLVKINMEEYKKQHTIWKNYWSWKENRNEKRSELEEKYGYDTKHAMHLIRLLRSGKDILEYGIVPVKRMDKDYLLDIRNGLYTYDEIVKESEKLTDEIRIISSKSNLAVEPNRDLAKKVMLKIYEEMWNKNFNLNYKIKNSI